MNNYLKILRTAVAVSATMFVLCGLIYPLAITGISQVLFAKQANGSLIYQDGQAIGSKIVGQSFNDERFMKSRPSAVNYNVYTMAEKTEGKYKGVATGSENLAATNPKLKARVQSDINKFLLDHPNARVGEIPADLLTASGSGLDPHISPASAQIQLAALAQRTGLSLAVLEEIVKHNTQDKVLGVFGEKTVNVLGVNIAIAKSMSKAKE